MHLVVSLFSYGLQGERIPPQLNCLLQLVLGSSWSGKEQSQISQLDVGKPPTRDPS